MSFGYDEARLYSDYNQWINTIDEIYSKYKKDIDFIPELAFYWGTEPYTAEAIFDEVSSYNYFKSIDLYGNELSASAEEYINLYKMAEHKKYILKAHVGEFGDSESVKNAVQKLNLNQ
jgi:adenosine deaminase